MKSPLLHLILWVLICSATFVGYGVWYSAVSNKSAHVADLQNQIVAKAQTSMRVAAARATLADIKDDESLVQSYFVPETGVVPFIDDLERRARSRSATMKVLSVSTTGSAQQGNLTLLLTLGVDGTFDAVMRTIGEIEYVPYALSLSKLAVHRADKNAWHADVEITVGSVPGSVAVATTTLSATTTQKKP